MNIIIGATELLASTPQTEEQRELTNTIQASSRGLLGMINDISFLVCLPLVHLSPHIRKKDRLYSTLLYSYSNFFL